MAKQGNGVVLWLSNYLGSREKRQGFSYEFQRENGEFWKLGREIERERDGNEGENGFGFFFIFKIPG